MDFTIEHVKAYSLKDEDLASINLLLKQLNPKIVPITSKRVEEVLDENSSLIFVRARDKTVVGMATLIMYSKLAIGRVGVIEDVVVDEKYRKHGIGECLMKELIEDANYRRLGSIRLTSKPERTAAHRLYKKMGFKKIDTDLFGLVLS